MTNNEKITKGRDRLRIKLRGKKYDVEAFDLMKIPIEWLYQDALREIGEQESYIEELKAEIENLQKEINDLKNTEQLSAEEKRTIGREVKREELYGQQLGMIRSYRMEIRRLKNTVRDLILKCLKLQNQIENFQEHPKEKE